VGVSTVRSLGQPPRLGDPIRPEDRDALDGYIRSIASYLERLSSRTERQLCDYNTGSATFNPGNLIDGAGETTTVTVTGAALGDLAFASFSLDTQGILVTAWVSAANVVSVRFQNETTGAINLAEGTLRAWALFPPRPV
jgi:hypothetical protein